MSGQVASLLDDRREAAAREVLAALAAGEGLVALTGPAGVGKTAVLDMVCLRLEGAGVRVLRVEGAAAEGGKLSLRALLAQVAGRDIEGMEDGAVEELLDLLDGTGGGVVVAVDDAQTLQPDAAEFFRLLVMLGRGQKRRSRVVFAGRPAFWDVFPDDPKGRSRLVGARIALEADEPEVVAAAPPVPAPEVAVPAPAPARRGRGVVFAVAGMGLAGVAAAGMWLGWPAAEPAVEAAPAVVVAVPEEAPVPGAPARPVVAESPVETPPAGGTARRLLAEIRDEAPSAGGTAPRSFAEIRPETPPVGDTAPRRFAELRLDPPPVGGTAPRDFAESRVEAPVVGGIARRSVAELRGDAPPVGGVAARRFVELRADAPPGGGVAPAGVGPQVVADPALVAGLMRRGAALVALGDISAARLAFGRAVAAGEAAAATALGRTYDPGFLAEIGGRGIEGDPVEAARWYRRGAEMGDGQAEAALAGLGGH